MARPIVLSNGELHVGINKFGLVHDFYFPYVGLENHAAGQSLRHRVGVWVDGSVTWLDDGSWTFEFSYPHQALVGHIVAKNAARQIVLEFDDAVDGEVSAFVRNIHVINLADRERDVRLFLHQAFAIGDSRSNTDTGQYLPDAHSILHYRGRRAFVVSAKTDQDEWFDQYSIGLFAIEGREGTYRDADDGELSMSAVEHGRVDSTLRFKFQLPAHASARVYYWVAVGTSTREALFTHRLFAAKNPHDRIEKTAQWWQNWLQPAVEIAEKLDSSYRDSFLKSVMLIKSQIDKRGAVVASTDTAMLNYSRDTYAYCWPRDGAYVMWPLVRMGYRDEPYHFFDFCRRGLNAGGYLMHKYRADGALGSSWHPYFHEGGVVAPPIQEDETALVLFVFAQFYHQQADAQLLREFYEPMVVPMANFLSSYVDHRTGLPKPSYDLWEEQFMTTTYTTAVVQAALYAAADLAERREDADNAVRWRAAADDIVAAARKHFYDEERGVFYKGLRLSEDGTPEYDSTIDVSSIFGAFMFGLFPNDGDEVARAFAAAKSTFDFSLEAPGLPRYENDAYRREDAASQGNWWYIASLWLAQYAIEADDAETAKAVLNWVSQQAGPTGVLSEQVNPVNGQSVSVAPLTWSQAEYVSTLLDTVTEK